MVVCHYFSGSPAALSVLRVVDLKRVIDYLNSTYQLHISKTGLKSVLISRILVAIGKLSPSEASASASSLSSSSTSSSSWSQALSQPQSTSAPSRLHAPASANPYNPSSANPYNPASTNPYNPSSAIHRPTGGVPHRSASTSTLPTSATSATNTTNASLSAAARFSHTNSLLNGSLNRYAAPSASATSATSAATPTSFSSSSTASKFYPQAPLVDPPIDSRWTEATERCFSMVGDPHFVHVSTVAASCFLTSSRDVKLRAPLPAKLGVGQRVVLRLFGLPSVQVSSGLLQDLLWKSLYSLIINNHLVPHTHKGVLKNVRTETYKIPCVIPPPMDITADVRLGSINSITVRSFLPPKASFWVVVSIVQPCTKTAIVRTIPREDMHALIKLSAEDDDDISELAREVSMMCPLAFIRIRTPARGRRCNHEQCFDLECFISYAQQSWIWNCPICSGPVPPHSLVVDTWFQGLLERTDEETSRVLITDEGEVSKRAAPVQLAVADTKTTSPFPLSVQDNPSDVFLVDSPPQKRPRSGSSNQPLIIIDSDSDMD